MATAKEKLAAITLADRRWALVLARAEDTQSSFVYAVKTTGVYCLPRCPSRTAKPENVVFYNTVADAERAGFRACRRCQPDQPPLAVQQAAKIADLCRFIETAEQAPTLAELAQRADTSTYHLHRMFKRVTGLTPKAYANAHRATRVRQQLKLGNSVTDALYDAGYNSNSRFYTESNQILGMAPAQYRSGGVDQEIRFALGECSLGAILVAQSARGICAIALGDDPEVLLAELQTQFANATLIGGDVDFEQLIATVVGFIEAPEIGIDLPLDIRGTVFQQRVWQALREIPVGQTSSYADIAQRIGSPKAVRAVAGACAANVLAVAIPCHRVVRSDGNLSGYRWGVARKKALLELERK